MEIATIIKGYNCKLHGDAGRQVTGITYDSRSIKEGFVFVAIKGESVDGHKFVESAISKGAAAVVCEKGRSELGALVEKYPAVSWIEVDDCRDALAAFSKSFYGSPSEKMGIVGITGTNGKTTTSYLIKSILEKWGKGVGLIGTISYMIKDASFDAPHTTPEASDFQYLLSQMADKECNYVITEVSSHALAQKRVGYTQFKVAIFTNLTQDHLDYHGTMEGYFESKARLFLELLADDGTAVINIDDPYGRRLSDILKKQRPGLNQITFAISDKDADIRVEDIKSSFRGTSFKLRMKDKAEGIDFFSPLVGQTGLLNVMSAVCATLPLNVPMEVIKEGIAELGGVKGRFESVDIGQTFLAIVDYAHTHDALERLITTSRQLLDNISSSKTAEKNPRGKIITVFGCGGNRDRGKRPRMGRVASEASDFVIVTSDNPRNEDPVAIIKDIEKGMDKENYIVIPDRRIAIKMAVLLASAGDIILVAGKGHEDYQELAGIRQHFSDREVLEDAIRENAALTARVRARKRFIRAAQC